MKEGLLWFDKSDKSLAEKVAQAAARFQIKFNRKPTTCYVNSADFDEQSQELNGISVRTLRHIQRHHLWIGVEQDPAANGDQEP